MDFTQRRLHQKYGTLVRIAPNECSCSEPEAIKKLYRTQSPLAKTDFYSVWGNQSFSKYPDHFSVTDEKLHAKRRRIVNHIYSLSNVLRSEEYIDVCSRQFLKQLDGFAKSGRSVDLGEWLQWYAFDVIGELYFGRMFGFMEKASDYGKYIASLDTLMPVICLSGIAPAYTRPLILASSVFSSNVRKALKAIDHIAAAARQCVAKRLEGISSGNPSLRRDILHQLLEISQNKAKEVDFGVHEVEYEAYVALFAGSDTTAIAMRAIFYFLFKSPQAYQKLQAELDDAVANGKISSPVKYAEAIELPFLCACIKEGMRLHPSVGLTMPRLVPRGGLDLGGYHIPEGYRVGMNAAVVQRDPLIFGKNPEEFIPDRWLEGDGKNMDRYMLNFGAGTRTCIGKNISLSEIHKLIPSVLRQFELELVDCESEWRTADFWFNKQTGVYVKMHLAVLLQCLAAGVATSLTLNGTLSVPINYTHLITPNYTSNASTYFINTKTDNNKLENLLQEAQNATFISYSSEFTDMLGPNPEAVLIEERNDSFAFEGATYDWRGNQVWFTSSILDDKPTTIYRMNLTDNTVHQVKTNLVNPNGAYYFEGYVYLVYFGNVSVQPGVARVNAVTYETEILANSWFGLPFNGPDDITVVPSNHDGNGLATTQIYFTDNLYGGLVDRPDSDYQLPSAIWRYTPSTGALVAVIPRSDIVGSNGVQINANGTKLYVGEYDSLPAGQLDIGSDNMPGSMAIFEYDLDSRGFPINRRMFGLARTYADGLKVDDYGRVWTGEGEGIVVRNGQGEVIGLFNHHMLMSQKMQGTSVAQVALAGNSAIILASTRLWRIDLAQTIASPGAFGN
ncbi:uncharacterized protein PV07_12094 [Cladophialophora immunda]|uniref:Uncharacterized protein n=1 Tax=Cladophialophora immunda TaxID=569365 RepID=A0A0D2BSZ6_9EURO|nr:uncharacterized protein PV07_12094 [Cladophialophora immunda]KIW22183.1 hypothetical protein PV07_12094 [Cladophialophora immunda]